MKVYSPQQGYDLFAPFYDKKLNFLNSFEKGIVSELLPKDLKKKKILDIGSGTGRVLRKFLDQGANITACDISEKMVKILKMKFLNIKTVKADIEELPFKDESFDIVTAFFVIVHLKNLQTAFSEVYRVLKSGGIFILSNVNQRKAPLLTMGNNQKIKIESFYHRKESVILELEKEGFNIERQEDINENGVWINQLIKASK